MLEIGSIIDGKYKVLNKIGQGGMSVVYLAMNEKANKQWAIKEVRKDGVKDFEVVKQGLVVETDMLKRLNHKNLPSIIDVIDQEDNFLIVMDYIEGNPLSQSLEEYGAQPQELVIKWAKQLCDVLGYLHTRTPAIIYRDMKPANVMLTPDGNLTLIDFGTAREYKERNIADTTCLGTVGYAAPEQFGGQGQTDARTDIYCLGATLYHLVTGMNPSEPPYEIKPIREINPSLSSGLEKIIMKCTQRNPDDRYQSCAELMYALEHYDEIDDRFRRKQTRRIAAFIGAVVMSGVCLGTGIYASGVAKSKTQEQYEYVMAQVENSVNAEDAMELCEKAMDIDASRGEAYSVYLDKVAEDSQCTVDEYNEISALITKNKDSLLKNKTAYVEVNYKMARVVWYYYTYGGKFDEENSIVTGNDLTRMKTAIQYLSEVLSNSKEDFEGYEMAELYYNIANFCKNANDVGKVTDQKDVGTFDELWKNISKLVDIMHTNKDKSDFQYISKNACSTFYFIVATYKGNINEAGIKKDDIMSVNEKVVEILGEDNYNSIYKKTFENLMNSIYQ